LLSELAVQPVLRRLRTFAVRPRPLRTDVVLRSDGLLFGRLQFRQLRDIVVLLAICLGQLVLRQFLRPLRRWFVRQRQLCRQPRPGVTGSSPVD
jgi:hypothetical protein